MASSFPAVGPSSISSDGVKLIVVSAIFFPLAIVFGALRVWARRLKRCSLRLNDYMIFLALFFQAGETTVLIIASAKGGIGYHITSLSLSQTALLSKLYVAAEPLWISANSCIKISILHLYITIFGNKTFRHVVYAVMGITCAYWLSTIVRMFFLCTPFAYLWDKSIEGASCLDLSATSLSVSVINLILDVMIILLPMPILWRLQMAKSKKLAVSGIFGIGAVICVITVLRIVSVVELNLQDLSYSVTNDGVWSQLEPCLGIINACLPVLRPVFLKISPLNHLIWTRDSGKDQSQKVWIQSTRRTGRTADNEDRHFTRLYDHVFPIPEDDSGYPTGDIRMESIEAANRESLGSMEYSTPRIDNVADKAAGNVN